MNPLVTKRAIVAAVVLTLLATALAVGLFITVRNYDRPSDSELVEISETLQHFFRTYDLEWPSGHYGEESLAPSIAEAMQRDATDRLALTVSDSAFAEELAHERVSFLQQARDGGGVVTRAGHRLVDVQYVRTTVERTVVVRVDTLAWQNVARWDPGSDGLADTKRLEQAEAYEIALHRQPDGWRVVGMRPAK